MKIPKTAETEWTRLTLHDLYTRAALAAWEGDVEAAARHAELARVGTLPWADLDHACLPSLPTNPGPCVRCGRGHEGPCRLNR